MTKISQVRETREQNTKIIFNMESAMAALSATPAKVSKSGALGELAKNIIAIIAQAGAPVAVSQLVAALKAGGMEDVTSKKVSDAAWLLAKNGKITKCEERGMYAPK